MIAANYFSTWIGGLFLGNVIALSFVNLNNVRAWIWGLYGIILVVTILFQWPFVNWTLPKPIRWTRRSAMANFFIQSGSYVFLASLYGAASQTSFYTDLKIVPPRQINNPGHGMVYFISTEDDDVWSIALNGIDRERKHRFEHRYDSSWLSMEKPNGSNWNLRAEVRTGTNVEKIVFSVRISGESSVSKNEAQLPRDPRLSDETSVGIYY